MAQNGDTIVVPKGKSYYLAGGISASNLNNVTFSIEGSIIADDNRDKWNKNSKGEFVDFLSFVDSNYITINGGGIIDGKGAKWWNDWVLLPILGQNLPGRPKLIQFTHCENVIVEHLTLLNSPSWHLVFQDVNQVIVRYFTINVNRDASVAKTQPIDFFGLKLNPLDLNTDGIDISATNVHIHDVNIVNDDDSIAVKPLNRGSKYGPCSANILVENSVFAGYGASIGSVPPSSDHNCVTNVTFRNISMPETGKGIYIKSNPGCDRPNASGEISNILYEDVVITKASMWAIWIGPQQMHGTYT
jgi:polygalacturonase